MPTSKQITFRGMDPSDAVRDKIESKIDKLDSISDSIISCRVVVEAPHRHHTKGNLYKIRIDLALPGKEIVIKRHPKEKQAHTDVYVAIRDAFNAARDQVEDYTRRRKRKVKTHETPAHGVIAQIREADDCGFIESSDGREIYFHRNSLVGLDYGKLEPGMAVRFAEEQGDKGPQASSVIPIGKHHVAG